MRITTSPQINLPIKREIYNVIKGPFVHAKKKELFQENEHSVVLQLFDCEKSVIEAWMGYVSSKLPAGVKMEVDVFSWYKEIPIQEVDARFDGALAVKELTFEEQVLLKKKNLIALLSK